MLYRLFRPIVLLALGVSGGCTQQVITPCNTPSAMGTVQITYAYTLNNAQSNEYETQVRRVAIYVFDSNGYFHSERIVEQEHLIQNDLPITLHLPTGRYTLVTFGGETHLYDLHTVLDPSINSYQTGLTPQQSHKEQFRLAVKTSSGIVDPLGELYGTPAEIAIEVEPDKVNSYFGELIRDTHLLQIGVSGLNYLPTKAESPLAITVTGNNTRLYRDSSIDPSYGTFAYRIAPPTYDNDQVHTSTRIFRIDATSNVRVEITHPATGRTIASFDLLQALMANPRFKNQRDIDREERYDLFLAIDAYQTVTLKVNGWQVINVGIL